MGSMWSTLDRTRRRLLQIGTQTAPLGPDTPTARRIEPEMPRETVLFIGRPEMERLGLALQGLLGPEIARPDTPDRLEAALTAAVTQLGGSGELRVNRRPAGLYTPEAWQVHIEMGDPAVVHAIRCAIREGVFAA